MNETPEVVTLEVMPATALERIMRSEMDIQIVTAHAYPRVLSNSMKMAEEMATMDEETAGECFYVLRRGGKTIEGPSVRLAEIVASSWGNIRHGARIVEIGAEFVTAQGTCHDLETNNAVQVEAKRRITYSNGGRYNEDMIAITCNAACAIAERNAIYKVIPRALLKKLYDKCKLVSAGSADAFASRREKAIAWYVAQGKTKDDVLKALGRKDVDDITVEDVITLKGMATSIHEKRMTIDEAMVPAGEDGLPPATAKSELDEVEAPEPAPADADTKVEPTPKAETEA